MRLFLISFFVVYGLMHVYAFMRIKAALRFSWTLGTPLVIFLVIMALSPLIIWLMDRLGLELAARVFSHVGYTWLGVMFLFVCVSLCLDVFRLAAAGTGILVNKEFLALASSSRPALFISFALAIALSAYGYFDAQNIRTEEITVKTSKLPPGVYRLRIAQISDVHLGLIIRGQRLEKMLDEVRKLEPDMLVSTGDLVDGQINSLPGLAEMLREIKPRYGKYAVTGNHEFYAGLDQALQFTESAGFRVLRGEAIQSIINIAGVEDVTGRYFNSDRFVPEGDLLSGLRQDRFTLLLKHRPVIDTSAWGHFDLQLSGHSHKGQIFPFYYAVRILYPPTGRHNLGDGSVMYLSRGTGTWGPPIRLLAPPEVTLVELVKG